ncbi:putative pinin isoform X1 [Sesbania bispinosa]|nr:putative pinin isoform X1 [Sesbania bispinosa]
MGKHEIRGRTHDHFMTEDFNEVIRLQEEEVKYVESLIQGNIWNLRSRRRTWGQFSSVAENPEVMPPSSVHCMAENDAMLKAPVPSYSSQHMESEGQEKNLGPVSSVAENPEVMPPSSVHCMAENDAVLKAPVPSCETLTLKKEVFQIHPKHEISSHSNSRENLITAEDGKSQGLDVDIENAGSPLRIKTFGGCSEPGCNNKAYSSGVKDGDARATKSSSDTGKDVVSGLLPRDCFAEDADGGQNSKNKILQSEMESRVDVKQMTSRFYLLTPPDRTRNLSPSAETKDGNKRPTIICDFLLKDGASEEEAEGDVVAAHQKRELKLEEGVKENVERARMVSTPVPFSTLHESIFLHSSEFPLKMIMQNEEEASPSWHPSHEKQKLPSRDNLFPENRYAFNASNNYFSPNLSSYSSHAEGMATIRSQPMYKEREDFPLVGSSRVPPHSLGYKSKIHSYDWEPSVPFRPSFFITSMNVSSPGDLYDPLRDSIEIPNIGDGSLKASLLIQGSSIQGSSQVRPYGDSAAVGKRMSDLNEDKSSVSSHNRIYKNEPNRSCDPHEKDCLATETEITSGTGVNYQNGKISAGQHTFGVEDITKAEKEWTEHDARHHGEGSEHKRRRVEKDKKIHEMDVDFRQMTVMQKEMKALKYFRAALVDLVKELLKPSWHEGRLSKDHIL